MEKLERKTLDTLVYEKLKEMILRGELKPGDQIIQEKIAKELGVSRTPLRKAISQLEKEYLIKEENGKFFVRELTKDELIIIFEIRALLEGLTARIVAENPDIEWLSYIESKYKSAYEKNDLKEYRNTDIEFHTGLAKQANNHILCKLTNNFWLLSVSLYQGLIRDPKETLPEHLEIISALKERDKEKAEKAMRRHLRNTINKIKIDVPSK
jgi:DNA-binding GntR family transcriptional regulator